MKKSKFTEEQIISILKEFCVKQGNVCFRQTKCAAMKHLTLSDEAPSA